MGEASEELKTRSKRFAFNAMRFVDQLPQDAAARYLGQQLLRAANAVAANYRAACRARSRAEFVSRIGVVAEEADESAHWLEMLALEAIFSASYGTSKRNLAAERL